MPYTILCFDKENKPNVRKINRDEHLKYLNILNLDTIQEIKDFIRNDPYYKAGLFKETKILNFKKVF